MDADESSGHGWVAGKEQGLPFLDEAGEAVADGISAEVWSVVSDAHHDHSRLVGACNNRVTLV